MNEKRNRRSVAQSVRVAALVLVCAAAAGASSAESQHDFVEVKEVIPSVAVDLRYATADNAFKKQLYDTGRCFLRRGTAVKLKKAQEALAKSGVGLKIWDGYRPSSVQAEMWKIMPVPGYLSPPGRGSHHSRGGAVDVTLIDKNGKELEMPTPFDEFSERSHPDYRGGTAKSRENRDLLRKAMLDAGFRPLSTEWWHFADSQVRQYQLSDISIRQLAASVDAKRKAAAEDAKKRRGKAGSVQD